MTDEEMTDEEMAEEYAEDYFGAYYPQEEERRAVERAYLAGLKACRPQWHDLQKDKNDLPKEYDTVLVCTEDTDLHRLYLLCNYHYGKWWFAYGETVDDVIAWCEIPTFDKEIEK
ncbi:MAG: hypothetical protein IKS93_01840 [Methanobrevibacter sp.]|nr:hypothetical protein [Methanobrevibacter sp.]